MEKNNRGQMSGREEVVGLKAKPTNMASRPSWSQSTEMNQQNEQDCEINEKEELLERCDLVRFPKEVEIDKYIILGSKVFQGMLNFELEDVINELENQIPGLEAYKEIKYIDRYAFPEVLILELENTKSVEKFQHKESFLFKGQEIIIVKPVKEKVYYAHVHTHFPSFSLRMVLEVLKRYVNVIKCETQTYMSKKMKTILNGNFKVQFTMKKGVNVDEIPQLVKFSGFNARILIQGQKRRCFRCQKEGHIARNCDSVIQRKRSGENGSGTQIKIDEEMFPSLISQTVTEEPTEVSQEQVPEIHSLQMEEASGENSCESLQLSQEEIQIDGNFPNEVGQGVEESSDEEKQVDEELMMNDEKVVYSTEEIDMPGETGDHCYANRHEYEGGIEERVEQKKLKLTVCTDSEREEKGKSPVKRRQKLRNKKKWF